MEKKNIHSKQIRNGHINEGWNENNLRVIHPKNYSERERYFEFIQSFLKKQNPEVYDIDFMKDFFYNVLNTSANPKEVIVEEIKKVDAEIEQGKRKLSPEEQRNILAGYDCTPFMVGYRHAIQPLVPFKNSEGIFYENQIHSTELARGEYYFEWYGNVLRGMVIAQYLPILTDQLTELEVDKTNTRTKIKPLTKDLSWENKTELCELIYTLHQSKRILQNGRPISEKNLIELFQNVFNVDLGRYHNLLSTGMTANKKTLDKIFFLKELLEIGMNWKPKKNRQAP